MNIFIIFPNQLFEDTSSLEGHQQIYLIEEYLYFRQYLFHKQKIVLHRSSMKFYQSYLEGKGYDVQYVDSVEENSDIRKLLPYLLKNGVSKFSFYEPTDNWLNQRIAEVLEEGQYVFFRSQLFINSRKELSSFFKPQKKKFYQTSFYKNQRKERDILLDGKEPIGGQWTYDQENRKKYPSKQTPPALHFPEQNSQVAEAITYTKQHFKKHIGEVNEDFQYPTNFKEAQEWLSQFLEFRFKGFGTYEDAISTDHAYLHHSLLSPLMNIGLLKPLDVVNQAVDFAQKYHVPINDVEGFVRQIVGWREFIRGVYEVAGSRERTLNFWKFERKLPSSFYKGETGILPVDLCIKRALKTGYNHHIERLMVLGNFMMLCEINPDEVYQWFMEMYIDAYDWVMVPNVYGMSQFADGGLMSTKPYISGSNYLKKMSNLPSGEWEAIWDGLFWRFIHVHRDFFSSNPRLSMMLRTFDKMSPEKRQIHLENAEDFLRQL